MSIFKCKMCGGTLEISNSETVGVCEYCGTKQTLPKTNDEVITNLFNRANNLRLRCEFDKATQIYEKIVEQEVTEAEAYWGMVLCKYGIEYVEDSKTFERIPTCHRTLYESVTSDVDYIAALEHADSSQRMLYEEEAKTIDSIQKNILSIVKNEKPFDVFICYKETDEAGKRTVDSVIANDIYHELTEEGFKVFYSAITLEEKLGQEYEPYIFSALNSAKVMLVIGTKPEYFEAVWVKNEWSRFLKLMKNDRSRLLIPCYKDMDAYELPEEFAHFQAQDMGKIGFINDVIRGIKKVLLDEEVNVKEAKVVNTTSANEEPLLKRAFMFLEDGEFERADEFCEQALNINPENARAYLGKLMVELKVKSQESLKDCTEPFDNRKNYEKVLRFADEKLAEKLKADIAYINERNEESYKNNIYRHGLLKMEEAKTEKEFEAVYDIFDSIANYKDANELRDKAEDARKTAIYEAAGKLTAMESIVSIERAIDEYKRVLGFLDSQEQIDKCYRKIGEIKRELEEESKENVYRAAITTMESNSVSEVEHAISLFETIVDWKDSKEKIDKCKSKVEKLKLGAEHTGKLRKILGIASVSLFVITVALALLFGKVIIPRNKYNRAIELMGRESYDEAVAIFEKLGNYKESKKHLNETKYNKAMKAMKEEDYDSAIIVFEKLDNYKESKKHLDESRYNKAMKAIKEEDYDSAYILLHELGNYEDSSQQLENIKPFVRIALIKYAEVGETVLLGQYEQDNDLSNGQEEIEWVVVKRDGDSALLFSKHYLDCQPYSTGKANYWEDSYLRQWLNSNFINTAFSSEQQVYIQETEINNHYEFQKGVYDSYGGPDTKDKIFIFSADEIVKYKKHVESFLPTEYALANNESPQYSYAGWLRSPITNGIADTTNHFQREDGLGGSSIGKKYVMPVLWVKVE